MLSFLKRSLALIIAGCWLLAGCTDGEAPAQRVTVIATATLQPTPTLASGLPTVDHEATRNAPTPTPTHTPTPTPTPTMTPVPATRIALGQEELEKEDFAAAAHQFETSLREREALSAAEAVEATYKLGVSYWRDGRYAEAVDTFNQLLAQSGDGAPPETTFYLGRARAATGDHQGAIDAYQRYLQANPDMAAYVNPLVAAAYLALGDRANAIAAYEAALAGPAHRLTQIENRQQLADLYLAAENYEAAVVQYDAIHDMAETENTRGQMTYLAGTALIMAGNSEAGYARYLTAVENYPRAYETYLGLVALVEAGYAVDEFQRGLIDFYADAYEPAVAAFTRYIEANPESYRPDTHLYLVWSYEGLGNLEAALAELDTYAQINPPQAAIERARLQARTGDREAAVDAYLGYLEAYPGGGEAPFAAWWAATLRERSDDLETAATLYQQLADGYSWHEDAPEALFRAGWLRHRLGQTETAVSLWRRILDNYPTHQYSAASMVWLLKTLPTLSDAVTSTPEPAYPAPSGTPAATEEPFDPAELLTAIEGRAAGRQGVGYYDLRARDVANGVPPFPPSDELELLASETEVAAQAEAETWLRGWLEVEEGTELSALSPVLAEDARMVVGEKLWQLGLSEQAKRELESLRREHANNALLSYQLALYFRDLGLYRSSILAATSLLSLSGQTVFEAPRFIGRLTYPVYYADLVLPLADQYGYDPLLQFSLVRQESLYESFARSGAAAQGLSQVIPDTGAYIAQQLGWPDFENEDLYKPHVGLAFGAFYLDQQLQAFDGHAYAALAAYNAGPGNAARWYEEAGDDHDMFLEVVTFSETRQYIERIYTGHVIYRFLYSE